VREAEKFGIKKILVAQNQKLETSKDRIMEFQHVYELLSLFAD
jgi:hypothetical protein